MRTAVIRKEHFNAAHRLFNSSWSDEKNDQVFGKCNNPNFHGHNYELLVKLIGEPDHETGYVYDMKKLSDIIKEEIIQKFDHRNLNKDVPEFQRLNPTAENIARVIWQKLRVRIDSKYDIKVTLYETERNIVEYPGE
jgi:6-pyruvoyltetrahydropterin/6-carboxytetrahydropterin synthase